MTQDAESIPEEVSTFCAEADALVREGRPGEAIRRLNFALDSMRGKDVPLAQGRVLEAFGRVHRNAAARFRGHTHTCHLDLERLPRAPRSRGNRCIHLD